MSKGTDAVKAGSITLTAASGVYTVPTSTTNQTITINTGKKTYAITEPSSPTTGFTYTAGTTPVTHETNYTFTITIADGYQVSDALTVSATPTAGGTPVNATYTNAGKVYTCTLANVTEAMTISSVSGISKIDYSLADATTGTKNYALNMTDADGNTQTAYTVNWDGTFYFTLNPNTGYDPTTATVKTGIIDVPYDTKEINQENVRVYKIRNVKANQTITVTIDKYTYDITSGTGNYTIKNSDGSTIMSKPKVEHGTGTFEFKVEPSTGYHVTAVATNPSDKGSVSAPDVNKIYTLSNVTAALTLNATVVENEYTVTLKDGGTKFNYKVSGSVVSSGSITHFGNYTFTVEAKDKYTLSNIIVSSTTGTAVVQAGATATSRTYILSGVTANTDITVTDVTDPRIVTLNAVTGVIYTDESNTTISGDQPVIEGDDFTFKVKATEGYELSAALKVTAAILGGASIELTATAGVYTLEEVEEDGWVISVTGVTKLENIGRTTLTVTLTDVEGLILTPGAGTHGVSVGSPFILTFAPAPGYEGITPEVTINGEPVTLLPNPDGAGWMYTIPMVYDDMRINIAFTSTGNEDITASRLYSREGQLYVEAVQPGTLAVYAISGQQLVARRIADGLTIITLPQGNYIVRLNNNVYKINIK